MHKSLILMSAFAALAFVSTEVSATTLTPQQVSNVCGKDLQTGGGVSGCEKKCGDKICTYNCTNKTGKCDGSVVGMTATPPTGGSHVKGAVGANATLLQKASPGGGSKGPAFEGKAMLLQKTSPMGPDNAKLMINAQPLATKMVSQPSAKLMLNTQPVVVKTQLQTMPPATKLNMPTTNMMLHKQSVGQIR